MSPRTKSILLLIATLVIGLLLGALINGYFVRQRLDRIGNLMTPRGFGERIERAIEPTSDDQREAIRAVLDAAAPRAIAIMRRSREDMRALNDSVKAQLSTILSDEQMDRLEKHLRFRRRGPFRRGMQPFMEDGPRGPRRGPRPPRFDRPMPPDSMPPPLPDTAG